MIIEASTEPAKHSMWARPSPVWTTRLAYARRRSLLIWCPGCRLRRRPRRLPWRGWPNNQASVQSSPERALWHRRRPMRRPVTCRRSAMTSWPACGSYMTASCELRSTIAGNPVRSAQLVAVVRDRAEAVGATDCRPLTRVGFPSLQGRHIWRGRELLRAGRHFAAVGVTGGFLGSRLGCGEGLCKVGVVLQKAQQLNREGQHQGGVLLGGHLDNSLEQPQLQRAWCVGHRGSCLRQPVRGLQFALGRDDASPPLPFSFCLA